MCSGGPSSLTKFEDDRVASRHFGQYTTHVFPTSCEIPSASSQQQSDFVNDVDLRRIRDRVTNDESPVLYVEFRAAYRACSA